MGKFIQRSLEEGEEIKYNGRLHWSSIWGYIFFSWLMALGGLAGAGACYYYGKEDMYIIACLVIVVVGIFVGIIGRIVRTRSEFAVTTTRFVQKDGIFNIKMTEIPLQRIETVNYYQTFWQRIIGTGCVELVGSGGTSHQVHCIEHPMRVRKCIVSAINALLKDVGAAVVPPVTTSPATTTPEPQPINKQPTDSADNKPNQA